VNAVPQLSVNQEYLRRGLSWLRGRLASTAEDSAGVDPGDLPTDDAWWSDPAWTDGRERPALEALGDRFGLSRFERLTLLLCAAPELDLTVGARCAQALGSPGAAHPTLGLALDRLPEPSWDALSAAGPLRFWRLIELAARADQPLVSAPARADERVVDLIRGLDVVDARLEHVCGPLPRTLPEPLPASQQATVDEGVGVWLRADSGSATPVLQLIGPDPVVRSGLAERIAAQVGFGCHELAADRLLADPHQVELLRLWQRETLLGRQALYVDVAQLRPDDLARMAPLLVDAGAAVLVGAREPWPVGRRPVYVLDALRPTGEEQEELWFDALSRRRFLDEPVDEPVAGPGDEHAGPPGDQDEQLRRTASALADRLDLNQVTIGAVVRQAVTDQPAGLWQACQAFTRPRLETYAQRLPTPTDWDDLVLPEREVTMLRHLVDQVRGRGTVLRRWGLAATSGGTGVTALFTGQSGTGKTMAAGVVARSLDLALYRIDLSAVVSKYIGETERNLAQVFDAADSGGVLLLFDEADALFGRRSEVKDSHDRYANIEVNYLLQRMEDYRGIALLTTNQRHAVDTAFLRRLRFVVTFPFPSPAERRALWQRAFPPRTPLGRLDLDRLAELAATGGMIRNIAVNTVYCAVGAGRPVTMTLVLEMARAEFSKLRLPVSDGDFAWSEPLLATAPIGRPITAQEAMP
jgi:hypothetical protein